MEYLIGNLVQREEIYDDKRFVMISIYDRVDRRKARLETVARVAKRLLRQQECSKDMKFLKAALASLDELSEDDGQHIRCQGHDPR